MKLRLQLISPASLASTLAAIHFLAGLFIGLAGLLMAATGRQFTLHGPVSMPGSGKEMVLLALACPFIAAVWGAAAGFVTAWLCDFTAKFTGGIATDCATLEGPQVSDGEGSPASRQFAVCRGEPM